MFGIGALIAAGVIDFGTACAWAIAGAIAGDGLSYWLGRHYKDRLRHLWPLSRHPQMVDKGEAFFHRHGGKSILFGRFFGPLRAIVPAVAGMMGMRSSTFFAANIASALLWAPAYLLPGMVFGASLAIAAEVGSRLVALILTVVIALWLGVWLIHRSYRYLAPRAEELRQRLLNWGRQHPHLGPLTNALIDPQLPAARSLLIIACVLLVIASAMVWLTQLISLGPPLARLDNSSYHLLQQLRSPWADDWLTALTMLGDPRVNAAVFASLLAWLVWRRRWLTGAYLSACAAFGLICAWWLKQVFQAPRPIPDLQAVIGFSFPSTHTLVATCLYGFLTALIARELSPRWRWLAYAIGGIWILGIAFSRLYLGAHWLSDVAAALLLGLIWVAVVATALRIHLSRRLGLSGLLLVPSLALLLVGSWHISQNHATQLAQYSHTQPETALNPVDWRNYGWAQLPAYRIDSRGIEKQPLNLQWAGELTPIQLRLSTTGWQNPPDLTAASAMLWLQQTPVLSTLPLPPQLHDGEPPALHMIQPDTGLVLYLWPSRHRLGDGNTPLWLGTIGKLTALETPYFTVPRAGGDFNQALAQLKPALPEALLAVNPNRTVMLISSMDNPLPSLQNSPPAPMDSSNANPLD